MLDGQPSKLNHLANWLHTEMVSLPFIFSTNGHPL
jgi:hypothetical protein